LLLAAVGPAQVQQVQPTKFLISWVAKSAYGRFCFVTSKKSKRIALLCTAVFMAMLVLGGCASKSLISEVSAALVRQQFGSSDDVFAAAALNPAYQYLRVQAVGQPAALLVMGYVDPHPDGDIEVWYSANHEVIKTQNGRIVATAGLFTDWSTVRYSKPPPPWSAQPALNTSFTRVRDEMPGYRFNLADQMAQSRLNEGLPAIRLPQSLPLALAVRYVWIREAQIGAATAPLPPAWYALERVDGSYRVAYSYQCLSVDLCLSLQRWPTPKVAL